MSMPLDASHMAPVTLKECPVNLGAPERVWRFSPKCCAIAKIVRTTSFLVGGTPAGHGHNGEEAEEPGRDNAHEVCALSTWNGHKLAEVLEQVQHRDLEVPLPVGSTLLTGSMMCALVSSKETQSSERFMSSISRNIHQDAITATRPGKHGPAGDNGSSLRANSSSFRKGNSQACLGGPRPLAAARMTRLMCKAKTSGMDPCWRMISCLATAI